MSTAPFTEHADAQLEEELAKLTDGPTVIDEDGATVLAIDCARKGLKMPGLLRATKSSDVDPLFTVAWQATNRDGERYGPERRHTIGGTAKLCSPAALRNLVAEATDEYPTIPQAKANRIASALRKVAELDDTGASPHQQTRVWIAGMVEVSFGETLDLSDAGDRFKAVIGEGLNPTPPECFTYDGRLYLRAEKLDHYLRTVARVSVATLSYAALCERLRDLGFDRKAVTAPRETDGHQPQRKYWISPDGFDWRGED